MGMSEKAESYAKEAVKNIQEKKNILLIDIILITITILFLGKIRPDKLMIIAYILTVGYLFYTKRKDMISHLALSSVIAIIWTFLVRDFYGYNNSFISIFGVNAYPLFAWSLGLLATYSIYTYFDHKLEWNNLLAKIFLFVIIYWPLLIMVEGIAYHSFDVKNVATASYEGIPLCDCIHAPLWMQISYFVMGPLFLYLCNLLNLCNPYRPPN